MITTRAPDGAKNNVLKKKKKNYRKKLATIKGQFIYTIWWSKQTPNPIHPSLESQPTPQPGNFNDYVIYDCKSDPKHNYLGQRPGS